MATNLSCSPNFCCAAMANNEVTYFAVVYITFPVTCAILADIDIALQAAKGCFDF